MLPNYQHYPHQIMVDEKQENIKNPIVIDFLLEQQLQQSSSHYRHLNHADGGITAGFGSLDSSAYNNNSTGGGGVHPLINSMPNS